MRAMARGLEDFVTSASEYSAFGTFPGPGTRGSQAVTWALMSAIYLAEKARIERAERILSSAEGGM